jgi:hypothetical protein
MNLFQGPLPLEVVNALTEAGHNNLAHWQLYLSGHSRYNPHIDSMVLTQKGREYHVKLLLKS